MQLEKKLNVNSTCNVSYEVVNVGLPWIRSDEILALTRAEILGYEPDLITLYAGFNDASSSASEISKARLGWDLSRWWVRRTWPTVHSGIRMNTGEIYDFEVPMLKHVKNMKMLRALAQEYSVALVDFIPYLDEEPELLVTYVHLSEEGNSRLADVLQQELMKRGVGCAQEPFSQVG